MSDELERIRARHAAPATEIGRWYGAAHDDVGLLLAEIDRLKLQRARSFEAETALSQERWALRRKLETAEAALQLACDSSADHIRERDTLRKAITEAMAAGVSDGANAILFPVMCREEDRER